MFTLFLIVHVLIFPLRSPDLSASNITVRFSLDLSAHNTAQSKDEVGIRGNLAPLSWDTTFPLEDENKDGIYTGDIVFPEKSIYQVLEYKYVYGDVTWELTSDQNRAIKLDSTFIELPVQVWDDNTPPFLAEKAAERLTKEQIKEDFSIMKEAIMNLHPGLYRFQSPEAVRELFANFEASLNQSMSFSEAFVSFSNFVPRLLCGHTLVNPWNQDALIKHLLFEKADKVPFTFDLVDKRMIITRSLTTQIQNGAEVTSINGTPVDVIIDRMQGFVSADGSNDGKRVHELQLTGLGDHELFDIYFPLLFPPSEEGYFVTGIQGKGLTSFSSTVKPISRSARKELMAQQYGPQPDNYDDLWNFSMLDEKTGYLQIGTHVTYKMSLDWKAFLQDTFDQLTDQAIPNLIIDIRGNSGGMDEVNKVLLQHISTIPITIPAIEERIAYDRVPESIRPYVGTWNDRVYDVSLRVEDTGNGYYVFKNAPTNDQVFQPEPEAYDGNVLLLVDAANSSATFFLARTAKSNNLATLVGEPTGGNLRGTNGGQMFFLRLPHSKVEIDIPIYGFFPLDEQPDRGVNPDVIARPTVEDTQQGIDTILQAALTEIE